MAEQKITMTVHVGDNPARGEDGDVIAERNALRERAERAQLERADAIRNAEIADEQRQAAERRAKGERNRAHLSTLLDAVERHQSETDAEPWHPRIHQDDALYSLAASIRRDLGGDSILDSGRGK